MRGKRPKSLRETLAGNLAAEQYLAASMGKPLREDAGSMLAEMGEKRTRAPSDPANTEAPAQAAVAHLLAVHPRVLWAVRINGGAMEVDVVKDGKVVGQRPLWFYRFVRTPGDDVTLTDFVGQMKDGRLLVIEMKKPTWKKPTTPREVKQAAMIRAVEAAGGIGLFAVCVEDVVARLG
jgi:hypothetical protein